MCATPVTASTMMRQTATRWCVDINDGNAVFHILLLIICLSLFVHVAREQTFSIILINFSCLLWHSGTQKQNTHFRRYSVAPRCLCRLRRSSQPDDDDDVDLHEFDGKWNMCAWSVECCTTHNKIRFTTTFPFRFQIFFVFEFSQFFHFFFRSSC